MGKTKMGPMTLIYPMPTVLVGADVDGKPNFLAIAWCGIANGEPPMISVAVRHTRHTLKDIKQNETFSVNVPSTEIIKEADYCGIRSGATVDKVAVCNFNIFYGEVEKAPLIEQCPVNLECRVVQMLDLGSHNLVIGRIEETHVSDDCLTDGKPDVEKIRPFIFVTPQRQYYTFGNVAAKAFSVGLEMEQ
ncbi:MAG TPA: flavin reductase family protein [Dehalococcoidia bacterium]|nr:flavin reductase family protein [Dehalococcoidia bacterium]